MCAGLTAALCSLLLWLRFFFVQLLSPLQVAMLIVTGKRAVNSDDVAPLCLSLSPCSYMGFMGYHGWSMLCFCGHDNICVVENEGVDPNAHFIDYFGLLTYSIFPS